VSGADEGDWEIVRPSVRSVGGMVLTLFLGGVGTVALGVGVWRLAAARSAGDFLLGLAFAVAFYVGLYFLMHSYFVAIGKDAVGFGHVRRRIVNSVPRSAIAQVRWHRAGNRDFGQLLTVDGSVLITFDALISKTQAKTIAETLGVPFVG
jgi:hypothetical protein